MRVLLHICCGPCSITVIRSLLDEGCEVAGFFYNPNIQPLAEYLRRREGVAQVAEKYGIPLLWPEEEPASPAPWLSMILNAQGPRCAPCWALRLDRTARLAKSAGFDAFSSSLLYSRRQNHEGIRAAAEQAGQKAGTAFLYRDFRPTWQRGIELSKAWGIYRQQYCGCIFSEYERYSRDLERTVSPSKGA